jgi:hypothetical protein
MVFLYERLTHLLQCAPFQRIQFAKAKSDAVAKAEGTFVSREKRKKQDEKGATSLWIIEEGTAS